MGQEAVVIESKTPQILPRRTARRRAVEGVTESNPVMRYFLAGKAADGPIPALGRELANENEALIESLKAGVSFFAVSEFRATADLSGRAPLIRKEAVTRQ